jgi:hypothetical protein
MADERGVTIVELLVVILLTGVIMGATLGTFTQFERTTATNQRQNDAQDQVRVGVTGLARELRNLASPTNELPQAVVRATPSDLVFQSVNSSTTRRVRYCLNTIQFRLWRQVQTAPFTTPSTTACPDSAWGSQRNAVANVVNGSRPVFSYNATDTTAITEITSTVWVDVNPGQRPGEVSLQTSVFLRNQNRSPTAAFTAAIVGSAVVLNGSQSEDPEGKALEYYWYDSAQSTNGCTPLPKEVPQTGCVGVGIVFNYTPPVAGQRTLRLVVRDPAGLTNESATQTVCVPGTGVTC